MGPSLFFPGLPLNENTRRTIAQRIRALFAGSVEGAWYDPSDLSTMQISYIAEGLVTASGQNVGLILDKRLGLAQTANQIADPDTGSMTPAGTSPPVVTTTTHLGQSCRAIAFDIPAGAGGLGVSSAYIPLQGTVPTGTLRLAFEISFSRALTGSEQIQVYTQSPSDLYSRVFNSSTTPAAVGAWIPCVMYKPAYGASAAAQVSIYSAGTWPGSSPVTVYLRAVQVNTILGNHAFQTTSGSRPTFRDVGGYRYLEFDGVDDYLRATFTIAQPIDRISALQQVTWTTQDQLFGGGTVNSAALFQNSATPLLYMYHGAFSLTPATTPGLGVSGVITERGDGASSRIANGTNAYTTGDSGTTLPGGITLGASNLGAAPANYFLHQLIMRGSTTAMTDAQVSACRALCAIKSGVTL